MRQGHFRWVVPALYILFLLTPIYWLVSMSFKTNTEITGGFTLLPQALTLDNYAKVFGDPNWRGVFFNSILYVLMNTVISLAVALPAASASDSRRTIIWRLTVVNFRSPSGFCR